MATLGDRVPMFKLRPYKGLLIAALFVAIIGGLLSAYFFIEEEYSSGSNGLFLLILTIIIVVCLIIGAYSRYGFKHLRHHRPGYKRG